MESTKSEFQENGMNRIKELFDSLYESSGHNLNQYISGDSLTVSHEISDELRDNIKDFLTIMREMVKQVGDIKIILEQIDKRPDSEKFMGWLEGYLYDSVRPYEEAKYLRETDLEQFRKVTAYVLENMIIQNIGDAYIDTTVAEKSQILCFRKVMYTFVVRVIGYNDSKEYIFNSMNKHFGLNVEKCEIWWELVKGNEDKLWKIILMRKMNSIENRLNQLFEYIEE